MFKKVCLAGLVATVFSFAQEETYIRNICDTLSVSATPKVELKLKRVEETVNAKSSSSVEYSVPLVPVLLLYHLLNEYPVLFS